MKLTPHSLIYFIYVAIMAIEMNSVMAQNKITVVVAGLRNDNGHILISLFNNDNGWPEDDSKTLIKTEFAIKNKKATIVFDNLPKGTYAVAIMQDENKNMKMDKTFLGMPKEGYGFSNNVMGTFGTPSFKDASFKHENNTEVKINMRY